VREPSLLSLVTGHWQSAPALDLEALLAAGLYLWAAARLPRPWPIARSVAFLAGVASVVVALQSGLDSFDDRLLSVHMVQHLLLLELAPVLLLAGRPTLLALRTVPRPHRARAARALAVVRPLTGPLPCLAVFTLVLILSHLPGFYDATLRDGALHALEHATYIAAGLLLWWPVLDGDPGSRRLGGLGKLVYMLAAMVPMSVIGAYLNRHSSLIYAPYAGPARALGLSALTDQYQAGAVMWVAGNCVMIVVGLWCSVAALVAEERRQRVRDARPAGDPIVDSRLGDGGAS
jgi:putative membrane protein